MFQVQLSPAFVIELWCLWHPDTMSLKRAPHLTCLHSLHMCLCLCIVLLTLNRNKSSSFFPLFRQRNKHKLYVASTSMMYMAVQLYFYGCNFTRCLFAQLNFCSYKSGLFFLHQALFRLSKYWTFAVMSWSFSSIMPCLYCPNGQTPAHSMWILEIWGI